MIDEEKTEEVIAKLQSVRNYLIQDDYDEDDFPVFKIDAAIEVLEEINQ